MIKIAANDSSTADKAAADVVCGATNSQNDINSAMNADNLHLFFFNGNYSIDAPVDIRSGCILEGDSVEGAIFNCNNTTSVFRTSAPATRHEFVMIRSLTVIVGSEDDLGLDLRGFTRSHFDRLNIAGFTVGVWFGGDLTTYESCWTNVFSRFRIDNCATAVKLSGIDGNGNPTANNILLTAGELNCRDATGAKAIDAIASELNVEFCDIGYGDASAGIVLGSNSNNARSVDCRFEWDNQDPSVYPISIATNSFYHYIVGNIYTGGCTVPNLYDANGSTGRYLQLDDFQRSADYPDGFVDFNIDVYFRRSPTFPNGVFVQGDMNSAFAAVTSSNDSILSLSTLTPRMSLLNGTELRLYSDEYTTATMNLDASNGTFSLDGNIVSTGNAPSVSPSTAAGTGATASLSGTGTCGLLTLTTGTGPTTGKVASIFWSGDKPSANYAVILTAANAAAVTGLSRLYIDQSAATTSAAALTASVALAASTTYKFYYSVLSY